MWLDREEYRELLGPQEMLVATFWIAVGLCRLNQVDPWPITYSLSNA
jgi:hypothetical protein